MATLFAIKVVNAWTYKPHKVFYLFLHIGVATLYA